ncbi:MAG: eukaryotic-like serine/threonine-protein kinase [Actinomycetota bacterium]|jgi:beta-lactam-binding protein with PASTA domain/tRNA A-37 threonylcarbamoyl transferase component Bud32|nr:eukaryotic-like serine/threonine-protein kinase [Actinomycetota bacterium]
MATVYLALDSRLDRTIALKVMHPQLAEDEEFVSRFIREARSAARLSHPNVVAVYDQGADSGHVFLAMEHVAGRTLRDLMREQGRLTPRQALDILEPVLAALGAAHQAGIVHRDVKPENVLLADDGRVKVADFGLARAVSGASHLTSTSGVLMGTVAYLSPEQVERGVADPRSDVYSVGILLFEMLTGAKPYEGETAIQVAFRHVHDTVPAPSTLVPSLPRPLDVLVARATSRDPDGRPADARRFLAEVIQVRRGLSDAELDPAGPPPVPRPAPRSEHTLVVPLPPSAGRTGGTRRSGNGPLQSLRQRRPRRGMIAFLLVLLLAAGLSGAAWYKAAGPGSYTTAPSLLGLTQSEAAAKARQLGLTMQVTGNEFDEQVPVNSVLRTSPAPNHRIHKNGTIHVVLSKGPERYAVPDVKGKTEQAAKAALTATKLSVGDVTQAFSDTIAKGSVVTTDPPPGTRLKRDEAVALVVSKGVQPVKVPKVVGMKIEDATTALDDVPLANKVTEKYDDTIPSGVVISQKPAAGGTAPKNSTVELVVSKGPPPVPVPNVVGMNLTDAARMLTAAGFQVRAFNLPGGPDRVLDQSPNGDQQAPKGSRVTLSVF